MDAATIELWLDVIENNDCITDKDKHIENIINLWKFSSCYGDNAHITNEALLRIEGNPVDIAVSFTDVCLRESYKSNYMHNIFGTISKMDEEKSNKAYYVEMFPTTANFTDEKMLNLEGEIINAIQGRLIPYEYIKKITRLNATPGIYTNTVIKNCTRSNIYSHIESMEKPSVKRGKWLVLVLDKLVSQCDGFYISEDIISVPFETQYEKLFLFDFYMGEVTELAVTQKTKTL